MSRASRFLPFLALLLAAASPAWARGGASADEGYLGGLEALEQGNPRKAAALFQAAASAPVADPASSPQEALDARVRVTRMFAQEARTGEDPTFRTGKYAAALAARAESRLGDIAREQGKLDEARAHYERAIERDPEYPMAHCSLGQILVRAGEHDRGLSLLERACRLAPEWGVFRQAYAASLAKSAARRAQAGEIPVEEAERQYARAIALDASGETAPILLGNSLYRRGDRLKGLFVLERAAKMSDGNVRAARAYADLLLEEGRAEEALPFATRARDALPNSGAAHRTMGETLYRLGRYEEALESLYAACARSPRDARAYLVLGKTYERLGWTDLARRALQDARAMDTASSEATFRLGLVHFQRGDLALASSLLAEAIAAAPPGAPWLDPARDVQRRADTVLAGLPAAQ